jgi:DNA polymerase-3 subunit epsilon
MRQTPQENEIRCRNGSYVVFDVETPNHRNDRISAIGITVVRDGAIAGDFYSLVDPETDFDYFNTRLTGISEELVRGAPTFSQLWPRIEPLMDGGVLVAHNAVFDMGVLKRCLWKYEIPWKSCAPYLCTVQMGRRILPGMSHRLDALCDYYGIALQHHHAGSDSRACAEILLRYMAAGADVARFVRTYSLEP